MTTAVCPSMGGHSPPHRERDEAIPVGAETAPPAASAPVTRRCSVLGSSGARASRDTTRPIPPRSAGGGHEASFASGCVVAGAVSAPGAARWGRAWPAAGHFGEGAGAAACVFTGRRPSLTVDISEVALRRAAVPSPVSSRRERRSGRILASPARARPATAPAPASP